MPKISIDQLVNDMVSINNQMSGLKMLLDQKKHIMAKYFEKSEERSVSGEDCTVYVRETPDIKYDIDAILETVENEISSQFIDCTREICNWSAFVALCKKHGIKATELKPFILAKKQVNQEKLSKLYESGEVSLSDLDGCYTAVIKKSVALKMKNVSREIPLR